MLIQCTNCHRAYPEKGTPYRCLKCGGLFDAAELLAFDPARVEPDQPGIWRYRHTFGLPEGAPLISLGEGNTPLVWTDFPRQPSPAEERRFSLSRPRPASVQVALKLEGLNPSGSFKDRGEATLVSFLRGRGVQAAVEDSSGNAGASFAAYSARAGVQARVFVPEAASGPKRAQIEAYGAEVVAVPGPRSNATEAVRGEAERGVPYASHAYLPFNIPGYATLAYELAAQLGGAPGTVLCPAGQGGLVLGLLRGFAALYTAGVIAQIPRVIAVQARACAPLWAMATYGPAGLAWVSEAPTLAEGVRVRNPLRGDAVLQALKASGGELLAVDEEDILPAHAELARRGFYAEPTSAIVWAALAQVVERLVGAIVLVLTGSGLKYLP
jgi:threonine synthase